MTPDKEKIKEAVEKKKLQYSTLNGFSRRITPQEDLILLDLAQVVLDGDYVHKDVIDGMINSHCDSCFVKSGYTPNSQVKRIILKLKEYVEKKYVQKSRLTKTLCDKCKEKV